jgi:hypothetical protein
MRSMIRPPSFSTRRSLVAGALLLASWGAPRLAEAMSCCGSTLAQPDRLGSCEKFAFQVGTSVSNGFGSALPNGTMRWNGSNVELDARLRLSGALRLSPAWQVSAETGWQQGFRRFSGLGSTGGALNDVALGARFDPPSWESWAFTATVGLPLGRTMLEAHDMLGADVTGRGAFSLRLGGVYQYDWKTNFVVAGVGLTGVGPERKSGIDPTLSADGFAALGHTFRNRVTATVSASAALAPALSRDGERLRDSDWRRVTIGAGIAYPLSYRSTLLASLTAAPPVGVVLRNQPSTVAAALSFRWAVMGGM